MHMAVRADTQNHRIYRFTGENNKETLHNFRWPISASFLGTK
jgi:hypothetical protein